MPYAISIKSLNNSADTIRRLWEQVSRYEERPSMAALDYPPHVTFALYDDVPESQLRTGLRQTFSKQPIVPLTFEHIRFFDNSPLVLWAAPGFSDALMRLHASVHATIDPSYCRPHYRPGEWTPHCTLGTNIRNDRRSEALAFTDRLLDPIKVTFDVADCVSFLPLRVIEECHLMVDVAEGSV